MYIFTFLAEIAYLIYSLENNYISFYFQGIFSIANKNENFALLEICRVLKFGKFLMKMFNKILIKILIRLLSLSLSFGTINGNF